MAEAEEPPLTHCSMTALLSFQGIIDDDGHSEYD